MGLNSSAPTTQGMSWAVEAGGAAC